MAEVTQTVAGPSGPVQVVVTDAMSGLERHNAIAKAMGAPILDKPAAPVFGPRNADGTQAHTDGNVSRFAQNEQRVTAEAAIAGKSQVPSSTAPPMSPPPPAALEQSNRLADFDREMQQKGLQTATPDEPGRFQVEKNTGITVDTKGLEALSREYAALPPAERAAKRGQYELELQEFYSGRRLEETRAQFQARMRTGEAPAAPTQQPPPSAPVSQFTPEQWTEGHKSVTDKEGWIPAERINPESLSGYRMPAVMEGGTVSSGIFHMLAVARAAGFTQAQVDAWANAEANS